jgi:long-chain fatty acid transport protein
MRRTYRWFESVLIGSLVVCASSPVCADGWKIQLQGGRELGTSYAGRSVLADDASVVWFNPAAMSWLTGDWVLTAGAPVITYQLDFSDAGSVSVLGQSLKGATTRDGGMTAVVPHLYLAKRLNARWWAGFGFNAPYGLGTNYGESWVGRYFATETTLRVFNLNPAFAVRPTPRVAIGFGLDVQRSTATLANMIDFGSIGAAFGLPLAPQAHDGRIQFTGGDWAAGVDLSVAWDAARDTRVGAAYRSRVDHTLAGHADFTVPPEARPLTAGGLFANTGAQTVLPMPTELSLSASRALQDGWLLLGDVTWTGWSRFQELRVTFDNPSQTDVRQPAAWNDSIRFAGGARKAVAARWTLSGGAGYETTPVPDSTRNARLPEENHAWFSVGAAYQRSEARHFDVYYSHLVTPNAAIRLADPSAGLLAGSVHWRLNVLGASAVFRF